MIILGKLGMRILIAVFVLFGLSTSLSGQMKHELKTPVINNFYKEFHPTYEILTKNERIGLELGLGYSFRNTSLRDTADHVFDPSQLGNSLSDEYKKRVFQSSLSLKFYYGIEIDKTGFDFFLGPFIEYDRINFLEPSYFVRQKLLEEKFGFLIGDFTGKQKLRYGINGGINVIFKPHFVTEFGMKIGVISEDTPTEKFVFDQRTIDPSIYLKIGYRFKGKADLKKVE